VIIKTLAELQEADERTLVFSPSGLGGRMRPEDAAEYQQQVIARHEISEAVAEGTRQAFEQLREICAYGVLCYPIYTIIADQGLLVFEQALRDRSIEFHKGTVTFIHSSTGQDQEVKAEKYEDVSAFLRSMDGKKALLRVGDGPETMRFNGMLTGLLAWARRLGMLRGQRNRFVEQAIRRLRNYAAHPSGYHLTGLWMPSARSAISRRSSITCGARSRPAGGCTRHRPSGRSWPWRGRRRAAQSHARAYRRNWRLPAISCRRAGRTLATGHAS
jgi:hypothetical protein